MDWFLLLGLRFVFVLYMVLVLGYSVFQRLYAYRSARRSRHRRAAGAPPGSYRPTVDVVVPCFNEEPELLAACCASLDRQDYEGELRVWVVDDGSRRNREQLLGVLERYAVAEEVHLDPETTEVRVTEPAHRPGGRAGPATRHRWTVLLLTGNAGKRLAQHAAVHHGDGDLVLTVDSDTMLAPDGVRSIVAAFRDGRVGAVTGNIAVENADVNLLTR